MQDKVASQFGNPFMSEGNIFLKAKVPEIEHPSNPGVQCCFLIDEEFLKQHGIHSKKAKQL